MVGVLIVTHSPLALSLIESSKMIIGESIDKCSGQVLTLGEDIEKFEQKFVENIDSLDEGDGVLVLVDLFAGTPANVAMRLMGKRKFECITGVNLAMLIEALTTRFDQNLYETRDAALLAGQSSIVDLGSKVQRKR